MSELKPRITENGIDYILVGDYYIPDLKLPEEHRPLYPCRRLLYPRFEAAGGTPSYRKVRTDAPGIFKGSPPS